MCLIISPQQIFAGRLFSGIHLFECIIFPSYKIAFSAKTESTTFRNNFKLTVEDGLIKLSFFKYETSENSQKVIAT